MIRSFLLSLIFLLCLNSNAFCTPYEVDVLSSLYQYDIRSWNGSQNTQASGIESDIRTFYAETSVFGSMSQVQSTPFSVQASSGRYGHAKIEASWLFQPKETIDELDFNQNHDAQFWSAHYASLIDETTGSELLSFLVYDCNFTARADALFSFDSANPMYKDYYGLTFYADNYVNNIWTLSESLDPSHIYRLSMGAYTHSWDDSFNISTSFSNLHVTPVPEPASMLLFGTGLIGFAGLILKQKKG